MDWLEQAAQLTIMLTFLGGMFAHFVMKPLNDTLKDLRVAIAKLSDVQHLQNERLNRLESALERVEKSLASAHTRIDKYLQKGGTINDLGH